MSLSLGEAVAAYTVVVDALLAADVDAPSHPELATFLAQIETDTRRVPIAEYAILARLQREADPKALGATSWWKLLTLQTRMSKGRALTLLKRAKVLAPRKTMQGQVLAPEWEHTAAGLSDGLFGDEHVEVIRKFFTALPRKVEPADRADAEKTLADVAATLDPRSLTIAAMHLLAILHPDGDAPAEAAAKKAGLTLGPQQPDGLSHLSGWVTPKFRALIEPVIAKFAERNRRRKHDGAESETGDENDSAAEEPTLFDEPQSEAEPEPEPEPEPEAEPEPEPEPVPAEQDPFTPRPDDPPLPPADPILDHQWRTKAQYTHDAFEAALDLLLRSNTLGRLNGLPTTVVVTTTLQELHAAAGYAVTAGGTRLPMRDLIAMAARAYHYLAVYDGHTAQTLHLGRAQRCATGAQKLALFGRERGCTEPGCDAGFYDCEAHHGVTDWKRDGQTNIDDLTLACKPGNQLIEDTDWTTRRRKDGRFEWIPPPHLDTGQPRTNNLHHPERLLTPPDDDDPL